MSIKLSTSGIRARYNELTPDRVVRFAQAFATYTGGGDIVVGTDLRPSAGFLRHAVVSGLRAAGARTLDAGVLPTPILQWLIPRRGWRGGVSISAGHNAFDWNSLVFLSADGAYLNPFEGEEYFHLFHAGRFEKRPFDAVGGTSPLEDAGEEYFRALALPADGGAELKFVLDCSYAFEKPFVEKLGRALGVRLVPLFSSRGDMLAKDPEPTVANAGFLATVVRETGSDGGFLINSDASRALVVDERARIHSEELSLPLFARIQLESGPAPVVTNYSTSHAVDAVARRFGARVFRTDVGQPHVVEAVRALGTPIGGEGSGSVVSLPFSCGFDSFVFMRAVIGFLRRRGMTLSALADEIPAPDIVKETVVLPESRIYRSLERIERMFGDTLRLKDGFYLEEGGGWLCVRASSTVSMIRLIGEGRGVAEEIARIREQLG